MIIIYNKIISKSSACINSSTNLNLIDVHAFTIVYHPPNFDQIFFISGLCIFINPSSFDRLVREEFTKSLDDLAATVTNQVTNSRPTVPVSTPNKYCCHICTTVCTTSVYYLYLSFLPLCQITSIDFIRLTDGRVYYQAGVFTRIAI